MDDSPSDNDFSAFGLDERLLRGVAALDFATTTPIQARAIPPLLAGRDIIGRARTGSGKTAAFGLPLLQRVLDAKPGLKALVLAPTRELAMQVSAALASYARSARVQMVTVYGGAGYGPQLRGLRAGAAVVVGTPGRLLDHLDRGNLDLSGVELVVLDEADEMLRMGFIDDVERLLSATPPSRQLALFSATMPGEIRAIADRHLTDPVLVEVEARALTVDHIRHRALHVPDKFKFEALVRVLRGRLRGGTLVFARTRANCAQVAEGLASRGFAADAFHGDMAQPAREKVLSRLRSGRLGVLVATDVAARGLDVENLTHVINMDMPGDTETYVHRVGRVGRAGREGTAISFITRAEQRRIGGLERKIRVTLDVMEVPSDADIAARQREILGTELGEALVEGPSRDAADIIAELVAAGATPELVATAAIRLLAAERAMKLDVERDERQPSWARPPERRPRQDRPDGPRETNEVELFIPVGKNRQIRPSDVVGALANELGISSADIGRVTIHDRTCFVGMPADVAKQVVAKTSTLKLRGMDVAVLLARPRTSGPPRTSGRPADRRPSARSPKRPTTSPRRKDRQPGGGKKGK